jgi:hypothetical protein
MDRMGALGNGLAPELSNAMLRSTDRDVQIARFAFAGATLAVVAGIALIAGAHVECAGGIARGAAGIALIAAAALAFRKYWRGDP